MDGQNGRGWETAWWGDVEFPVQKQRCLFRYVTNQDARRIEEVGLGELSQIEKVPRSLTQHSTAQLG